MTKRSYPLWLLRDWPAFIAFLVSFWSFILAGFIAGRKAMRGKRVSEAELQTLFQLYAKAESRLDHAIWRQAWRACGYSAKCAEYVEFPAPTDTRELNDRFLKYNRALHEMEGLVVAYADDLRKRFNIPRHAVGDPNAVCPLRHAANATSPGFAGGGRPLATTVSSTGKAGGGGARVLHARDGGGSRDSRGYAQARAPPQPPMTNISRNPLTRAAGTRTYVRIRTYMRSA